MKRIKFRVYKKRTNQYETENRFLISNNGGFYEWDGQDLSLITLSLDDYVIERHTGFKDSEGKEIYEGDIVRYESIYKEEYEVVFGECYINPDYYGVGFNGWYLRKSHLKENEESEIALDSSVNQRDIKIISNIHEVSK